MGQKSMIYLIIVLRLQVLFIAVKAVASKSPSAFIGDTQIGDDFRVAQARGRNPTQFIYGPTAVDRCGFSTENENICEGGGCTQWTSCMQGFDVPGTNEKFPFMSLHMSHAHERMDYHVPEDDPDSSRVPKVAISTQEPFRILHASGEWLDLFQFSREEIIGRNLRMICGPATNIMGLKRVVETAVMAKEGQTALSLYSRAGTGAHLSVKASCRDDPTGEVCTLSMSLSDAVPLKDALQCEDGPCAIISAEPPHLVEQVNLLFCSQFDLTSAFMAGKTLRIIQGPSTNAAAFSNLLAQAKAGLSRQSDLTLYSTRCVEHFSMVRFQPLTGKEGEISHILVRITPLDGIESSGPVQSLVMNAPKDAACLHHGHANASFVSEHPGHTVFNQIYAADKFAPPKEGFPCEMQLNADDGWEHGAVAVASGFEQLQPGHRHGEEEEDHLPGPDTGIAARDQHMFDFPAEDFGLNHDPKAAWKPPHFHHAQSHGTAPTHDAAVGASTSGPGPAGTSATAPPACPSSLKLVPRRKRSSSGGRGTGALMLTTAKLDEMGRISMKQAAQRLGIAPSTLKKACRKLGLERWPHGAQRKLKSERNHDAANLNRDAGPGRSGALAAEGGDGAAGSQMSEDAQGHGGSVPLTRLESAARHGPQGSQFKFTFQRGGAEARDAEPAGHIGAQSLARFAQPQMGPGPPGPFQVGERDHCGHMASAHDAQMAASHRLEQPFHARQESYQHQAHHHHQQAHQEVHQQAHHPPDMDRHSGFFHRQHSAPGLAMMQGGGGGGGPEAHHEGGWEQGMQAPDMGHLHLSEMPGPRRTHSLPCSGQAQQVMQQQGAFHGMHHHHSGGDGGSHVPTHVHQRPSVDHGTMEEVCALFDAAVDSNLDGMRRSTSRH